MLLATYLLIGAIAGLLAGLFGVGGGIVIVPVLLISFDWQQFPVEVLSHMAIGTSLGAIIVTSISSIIAHQRKQAIDWPLFWRLAPAVCIGVFLGVNTAEALSSVLLRRAFAVFAVLVGIQMLAGVMPAAHRALPGRYGLSVVGTVIGWFSALFGVGGGSLSVPYMSWCNVPMQRAVATSAAVGLPIAIVGAVTNIGVGWDRPGLPEWSLGFIYLPALCGIVISSAIFARFGAKLAHSLPSDRLKQCFGLLLVAVGAHLLISQF